MNCMNDFIVEDGVLMKYTGDDSAVSIPDGVTEIGRDAFKACTSLTSIHIPDGVTSIGISAFKECTALETVRIPDSVVEISCFAFEHCTDLTEISIPNAVTEIEKYTFSGCSSLERIHIPDSVKRISQGAFSDCKALKTVQIPDSVEVICAYVFRGCIALTDIHIPASMTSIEFHIFENCTALTEINIPDSATEINEAAFEGCSALAHVHIPDSVKRIDQSAFSGCTALTDIVLPESLTKIDFATFHGCSALKSIHISKYVREIKKSAFHQTNITNISVDPDNPFYHSSGNCLILTGLKELLAVAENSVIPSDGTVTQIADGVFKGLPKEFSATELPDVIRDIKQAFAFSKVQHAVVPASVTRLSYGAFLKCEALESVVIPASVTEIEQAAFKGCKKISDLEILGTPKISTQSFERVRLTRFKAPDLAAVNGFSWWRERFGEQNTYLAAFDNFNPESKIAKYAKKCYEDAFGALLACDRVDLLPDYLSLWKKADSNVFNSIYKMAKAAKKAEFVAYLEDWKTQNMTEVDAMAAPKEAPKETPKKAPKSKPAAAGSRSFEVFRGILKEYKGRAGEVVIPETVTKIGEKAFKDCTTVKKVILHDGITKVEQGAFFRCSSLREITIGNGVTHIGKAAFWDCKELQTLFIPATVTNIGACAFEGCDSLTIIGYANSKAEKYAKEYRIKFEQIDSK